jgi:alkanesulfonate monooxygenase SsuD/methylene tetrahydromethanopterin reductase-like flavin-dependent oxidoreductase (luciferase family)
MKLSMFMMPLHPPHRQPHETYDEDRAKIILADKLGFAEIWLGQHFTCATENIASPLMFLASLIHETKNLKFGTGVLNLPCHNPAIVAAEVAQFDHMAKGRFLFGIGPGALATDFALFNTANGKEREERTLESIEVIEKIWASDPPYRIKTKHYGVTIESDIYERLGTGCMPKPYQKPMPPVSLSVMSPFSSTAKRAGERGWGMISANFVSSYIVGSHWQKYLEGCEAVGRRPDPSTWRVSRNVLVARTDEEAKEIISDPSNSHYFYMDYLWEVLSLANYTVIMKADPKTPDAQMTVPMMLDDMVIYGSPSTVAEKIVALREKVGPFENLAVAAVDWGGVNRERE